MRDLQVGDMVMTDGSPTRTLIVLQVIDTGKPRYGNQKGTRRRYKLCEPATGTIATLPETQVRAEYSLPDS